MGDKLKSRSFTKRFFSFLLDCVSFNTPQAIIFNISVAFLVLAITPINYVVYSPFRCVFHILLPIIFGDSCPTSGIFANCEAPSCGLTRAMLSLLHGDIHSALEYNLLVIPVFFIMLFILIFNIYKLTRK